MIGFEIQGHRGINWGFGSRQSSPLRLVTDPTGIMGAELKNEWISTVAQPGAYHNGTVHGQVNWEVEVHTKDAKLTPGELVTLAVTWRRSLGRGELLKFLCESEGGGVRTQGVRLDENLPYLNLDLLQNAGYFRETVRFKSESSWFKKRPLERTFTTAQFAAATIPNPSDIDAAPIFEITGPLTSPVLGVGESIALTGAVIPAGQTWRIVTDKRRISIIDVATGANKLRTTYEARGSQPFVWDKEVPAEPGEHPLTLGGTGGTTATRIKVILEQNYTMGVG